MRRVLELGSRNRIVASQGPSFGFADDAELVRIQMAQMETWIYLLLHTKGRPRSN
jgi:hypothetical protein